MINTNPEVKLYISTEQIWGNKGNEFKPCDNDFRSIQGKEAQNFNLDYIDELHVKLVLPVSETFNLIRVSLNNTPPQGNTVYDKYYYLSDVIEQNIFNKTCIFALDIWCTYVLGTDIKHLTGFHTTQFLMSLDGNVVNPYGMTPITPGGIPSNDNTLSFLELNQDVVPPSNVANVGDIYQGDGPNTEIINESSAACPANFQNIYYVFRTRSADNKIPHDPSGTSYSLQGVGAIPVLFGDYEDENKANFMSYIGKAFYYGSSPSSPGGPTKFFDLFMKLVNCPRDISNFLNSAYKGIAHLGLGDFVGCFYGPSYGRIDREKFYDEINNYAPRNRFQFRKYSSLFALPLKYIANGVRDLPSDWSGSEIPKGLVEEGKQHYGGRPPGDYPSNYTGTHLNYTGFAAVFIPDSGVPLYDIKTSNYTPNGQKIYSDYNNIDLKATRMYFTDHFILSNGQTTVDLDTMFPVSHDIYENMLAAQRNTMNTSLALTAVNGVANAVSSGIPNIPVSHSYDVYDLKNTHEGYKTKLTAPMLLDRTITGKLKGNANRNIHQVFSKPKKSKLNEGWANEKTGRVDHFKEFNPAGSIAQGAMGLVGAGLQFANTLAQQEAYKRDLRIQTSSQLSNYTSTFAAVKYHTSRLVYPLTNQTLNQRLPRSATPTKMYTPAVNENYGGYKNTEFEKQSKFYGFGDYPKVIPRIAEIRSLYLKITPTDVLRLESYEFFQPNIRSAVIALLENGVRIGTKEEYARFASE